MTGALYNGKYSIRIITPRMTRMGRLPGLDRNNIPEVHSLQPNRAVPCLLKPGLLRRIRRTLTLCSLKTPSSPCRITCKVGCELAGVGVENWARCAAEDGCHCKVVGSVCSRSAARRNSSETKDNEVVENGYKDDADVGGDGIISTAARSRSG